MSNYILKDTTIINEGQRNSVDVLIKNNRIARVVGVINTDYAINEINAQLLEILPKNCCSAKLIQRLYDLNRSFVN